MKAPTGETGVKTYAGKGHHSVKTENPKTVKVYFELTNICNFNCDYCPIDRSERRKEHMDFSLFQKGIKDIAKDEERLVRDGEIIPACAQSCPTKAITFGNFKDKNSKVYKLAHSNRAYRALDELGTEPAVNYLRRKINNHDA